MIKEQNKVYIRVQMFSDLALVIASFFIGYFLRDKIIHIYPISGLEGYLWDDNLHSVGYYAMYMGILPVLLVVWISLLSYFGMYQSQGVKRISEVLLIVMKTAFIGFILIGSYIFILRLQEDISRLVIGFTFVAAAMLISLEKILLVYIFKLLSKRDARFKSTLINFRRILVIGTNKRAKNFIELVNKNADWGIRIVGIVDIVPDKMGEVIKGHNVIGSLDDIPEIISKHIIDEVVFIVPRTWLNKIEDIVLYCESVGLKVNIAVNLFELKFSKAKQTDLQGFPLLAFESHSARLGHIFIKRIFDFVTSGAGLIILMPLFVSISILIKSTSEGPIFFKQVRCSINGRKFLFYKFRTMVADAESRLDDILRYNEMDGPVFKMTDDPRITGIGKWLRKYSIDELPQLWNVFKGDMSLVGPRPPLPSEVEGYDPWQRRRLSMRPGITCLWQISGRSTISNFNEWLKLDLEYIDNWSLSLDLKILFKTIPIVLSGVGAK